MNILYELLAATTKIDANAIGLPKIGANQSTINIIVNAVFVVIGAFSVLFLLLGAVRYVLSNGDQNQISRAKDTILYAIIGIVITTSAFVIVQFVLGGLS